MPAKCTKNKTRIISSARCITEESRIFLEQLRIIRFFYEYLPNDLIATLGKPQVYSGSNTGPMADDFEFRYENEVIVYIGQILFEEEKNIWRKLIWNIVLQQKNYRRFWIW